MRTTINLIATIVYIVLLIEFLCFVVSIIAFILLYLRITLPITYRDVCFFTVLTFLCFMITSFISISVEKIKRYTFYAEGHISIKLLKHDILKCFESGIFLLIRTGIISLAPLTMINVLFPSNLFRSVFPFCILVSTMIAASISLSDYESSDYSSKRFIDKFGKGLYDWVPLGKHVVSRINLHDMRFIALLSIVWMIMITIDVYAFFTLIHYINNANYCFGLLLSVGSFLFVIFYRKITQKIKSEEVRKHFAAVVWTYVLLILPPAFTLLVKYHIIIKATILPLLSSRVIEVVAILLYAFCYFTAINYLRYAGIITETE